MSKDEIKTEVEIVSEGWLAHEQSFFYCVHMKNNLRKQLPSFFFSLFFLLLSFSACNKEKTGNSSGSTDASTSAVAASQTNRQAELAGTLLSRVPQDTLAFALFQGNHPSYTKLKSSPWGKSFSRWSQMAENADPQMKALLGVLPKLGIQIQGEDGMSKVVDELLLFAAPSSQANEAPMFAALFHPTATFSLPNFFQGLKRESGSGVLPFQVQDVQTTLGAAIQLLPQHGELKEIFIAERSGVGVITTSKELIEKQSFASSEKLPAMLSQENFQKAFNGFPGKDIRYGTFYVDFEKAANLIQSLAAAGGASPTNPFPVKALAVGLSMDEAPKATVRLLFDESHPENREMFATLGASSTTDILGSFPEKALFALSVDGTTLSRAKERLIASAEKTGMGADLHSYRNDLSVLDGISRIAIAAKGSAPGMSLLPVPEFLLVFEVKESAKLSQSLERLAASAVSNGLPGMDWKNSTEEGVPVRSMQSPFGVGIFLAATPGKLVVASSKGQLQSALKNLKDSSHSLSQKLNSGVTKDLFQNKSVGAVYVNFQEIATTLEGLGGMLSIFGAQAQKNPAQQMLSPENVKVVREMGVFAAAMTLEPGALVIRSSYEKS